MDTRFTPGRNSHGSLSTLRQAADSAQMLVWMTDPDDVFTYLSCGASVLYGNGETLDMSAWSKLAHPEDMARVDALFRQAREARGEYRVEYRIKKSDGSSRRMMGCGAPRFSDSGEFQGYIGTFVDASDRHAAIEALATEELKKREQRFRSLTDLSTDWYWETDENDRFTFISEGVQRLFGAPAERLIGTTRADLATTLDQPGLLECFQQVSNREPFRNIRYAIRRSVMGMMRYTNISGEPVFENGVFKGYRGVGHDITADIEVAEQLAELAAENKALIENSPDIMLLLDHEGRILRVNDAVTNLIGYRPGELLGRHFLEFVVPDDAGKSMAATDELRRNNMVQDLENRWTRKDGRVAYLSWAIRWADDRKLMYATGRDVSESHRTRAELHKSKNSLVSMLESIGDAFFAMDRDWRITYANRKTAEFVGRTQQALIGKIVWDALPEMPGSSVFRVYRNAMATRKETFFEAYYEPADAWVEVRTYPYEDGLSVFFHDITARRQAESAIRDSEQRFREVIEMTPVGYLLTDAKGTLLAVNPALCSISGYSQEALVGQSIMTLFTTCPCDGALFAQGGAHAVHGREAVLNHAHGHPVYVLVNASIKRDGDGNGLSLTAFLTDITERKEAEANLEQLAKHDTLTGLPNRVLLNDHLQHMLGSARKNEAVAVMFIDLDRFKEVNDSMGHEPGDILLREVARRLQKNMRPSDIVARLGGDEFVVAASEKVCALLFPRRSTSQARKSLSARPSASACSRMTARRASCCSRMRTPRCTVPKRPAVTASASSRPA
jgi:diguanylate cyclase (GGDEF)-like protein/PAS domain S-box-containing protein